MKRKANIFAALVVSLYLTMAWVGRDLAYGIYEHGQGVFPSAGQIDFLLVFPGVGAIVLCVSAWFVNWLGRWYAALAAVCACALLALLPYLLVYGGGV